MKHFSFYIIFFYLLCLSTICKAQTQEILISGCIKDELNRPMELVNVTLLKQTDSIFMKGVVTNNLGHFTIELPSPTINPKDYLLSFSYIGYQTKYIILDTPNLKYDIQLEPLSYTIDEFTIVGQQKPYKMDGSKIKAPISGSLLSSAGNAFDVMKHLPFLKVSGTDIDVFGKGKPIIYINRREVRSTIELSNLDSKRIKSVTIDTSPGPEYLASVTSVIHIETLREEGVGISGDANFSIHRLNDWNEMGSLYLSYVNKSFTLYGDFSTNNNKATQAQYTSTLLIAPEVDTQEKSKTDLKIHAADYSSSLGFDYTIYKNHQFGGIYRFNNQWKGKGCAVSNSQYYNTQILKDEYLNTTTSNGKNRDGYLNLFYSGIVNSWKLELDIDYVHGKGYGMSKNRTAYHNGDVNLINSTSDNNHDLFASKFYTSKKFKFFKLLLGTQFTWTNTKYDYKNTELHEDLPSSFSHHKQQLYGLFGSFSTSLGNLYLSLGLRYEKVKFNYYLNKEYKKDQSLKDNYIFPTLLFSYPIEENGIEMSLSYRRTIARPSYYSLRADIQYNSPHSYEAGNPLLKNTFVNDFSYNFRLKNLMFIASYKLYENQVFFITKQFEKNPITLSTFINSKSYKTLSFSLSYYHTLFSVWTPQVELSYQKPFLKHSFASRNIKYNRAEYSVSLDNTISLPYNMLIRTSMTYCSPSDKGFSRTKNSFVVDISAQKSIKDRMTIRMGVGDIFNSNKERWRMNYENVLLNKRSYSNARSFYISLSYSFNKTSQYERSGANQKEINRL